MAIQVGGTTVIDNSRVLSNVTGLKTINSTSILGSGNISAGASTTYGDVGTYAIAVYQVLTSVLLGGNTVAGSSLRYNYNADPSFPTAWPITSNSNPGTSVSSGFSGTWRLMCGRVSTYPNHTQYITALWVRIS